MANGQVFSGDIIVGGGGSIRVATATLLTLADRLQALERQLHTASREVGHIDRRLGSQLLREADAPASAYSAERGLDDAVGNLAAAADRAALLAGALHTAAAGYGAAEASIDLIAQEVAAELASVIGLVASTVGVLALPGILMVSSAVAAVYILGQRYAPDPTRRATARLLESLEQHRDLISDPFVIELIRLAVMSADDALLGAMKIPAAVAHLLGDEGLGVVGLDTSAAGLVAVTAVAGALRETAVTVEPVRSAASTPAVGYADRAARLPTGPTQIRIDRYSEPGAPDRFEVYLSGTIDFSPVSSTEPWDMTSNIGEIAGRDPGAYRAVVDAMRDAGIDESSSVVLTGYSQGGLIAAMVAASGDYSVRGLYTLGAPAAQVDVPHDIPWVATEHTDDVVPAVGGTWAASDPVTVRREVFDDVIDHRYVVPAHQIEYYRATAAMTDESGEPRLMKALAEFDSFGGRAPQTGADAAASVTVESTWYLATRVQKEK